MIEWVFLDVGNVLLDEDPLTFASFRVHVEAARAVRPDLTFGRILAGREERATAGSKWPLYDYISKFMDNAECTRAWEAADREVRSRFAELSPEVAGADDLLRALGGRFRLGLIANQGPECRRRLADLGWLGRFDVVALGEEEGVHKPDPGLFRRALDRAGVGPSAALMVGDRLDNDIEPAARLGMATAWIRWPRPAAKGWSPVDEEGRAYLGSLGRIAATAAGRPGRARPTWEVDDLAGLAEILSGPG